MLSYPISPPNLKMMALLSSGHLMMRIFIKNFRQKRARPAEQGLTSPGIILLFTMLLYSRRFFRHRPVYETMDKEAYAAAFWKLYEC